MNLADIRAELPVLERLSYLNTGTFGPLPRRTAEVMVAEQLNELEHGRSGAAYWEHVRGLRQRVREAIAGLIGAAPENVALTRSTTDGCNVVVSGLGLGPADEVVTTDCEHFGLLGALAVSGARVRVARIREGPAGEAAAAILAELSPRTRLIAISHVVWTTGQVMAVSELAAAGIPVLVDGAQGTGAVPVDVGRLACDFYTVSGQKWLLGPDGTGALYVAPGRIDGLAIAFPPTSRSAATSRTGRSRRSRARRASTSARFPPRRSTAWSAHSSSPGAPAATGSTGPGRWPSAAGSCSPRRSTW